MILYIVTCILQIVSAEKTDQINQAEIIKAIDSAPVEMKEIVEPVISNQEKNKQQNIGDKIKNIFFSFIGLFKSKSDKN